MKKLGFRQGDILFAPRSEPLPETCVPVEAEGGRLIAASGEATGHHHSFPHLRGAVLFRDDSWAGGTNLKLSVAAPAPLEHQEHTALEAQPHKNGYDGIRQRTYTAGVVRRVVD